MTVDPSAAIRARIAQIEARFGVSSAPRVGSASSTAKSDFASALSAAQTNLGGGAISGASVAAQSLKYLGVPYQYGGTDPATGLDCSAFVQRVYADLGIDVPRVASDQAKIGTAVPNLATAQPGDLITFGNPAEHIGIYLGNNKMIEAPHTGDVVKIIDVPTNFTSIRRVLTSSSSTGTSSQYDPLFQSAASKYGVSASVLQAMAKEESGFNANAVSGAGAQGLMQLMPSTAAGLGVDPFDPAQAVDGAARLLAGNLQQFGTLDKALAAYNAGPAAVQRYGGVPPYAETQGYVNRIHNDLKTSEGA
jgi:peptidoglycan DL-endopeptidase CwlO